MSNCFFVAPVKLNPKFKLEIADLRLVSGLAACSSGKILSTSLPTVGKIAGSIDEII